MLSALLSALLPALHAAFLFVGAVISWRDDRGLSATLLGVLAFSFLDGWPWDGLAHVAGAGASLAGVLWACRGAGALHAVSAALAAGIVLVVAGPEMGRAGVGLFLGACYALAFVGGLLACRTSKHAGAGIITASCATGAVGCVLWALGGSGAPAHYADVTLLGAYVYTAVRKAF